jgi:pimeloyl-ACP methyl ester carboxylesterase
MADGPLPSVDDLPWPWPGRMIEVAGDVDVTLHLRDTPGPAGGPRAVYLHGLAGSATNWTDLAGLLAGHVNGTAVDLPGFGMSPPRPDRDFQLTTQADVIVRLLTELGGEPVHLFGNSMGGIVAAIVAANRPDLVTSLTLISPAMPDLRPNPNRLSEPRIPLALLPVIGRRVRRELGALTPRDRTMQLLRLCFYEPDKVTPERLELAVGEYTEVSRLPWAGTTLGPAAAAIVSRWLARADRSLWTVVERVQAPTLVIWGDRDRVVTVRKAPRTARTLQRGRLLVLPRTGHAAQMERPVSVARAVLGMWQEIERGGW